MKAQDLGGLIKIHKMDYHYLNFKNSSFDGVYTMETFVHATSPRQALNEFFRVLKPGGSLTLHEYDYVDISTASRFVQVTGDRLNRGSAMPSNLGRGVLLRMIEEAGFQDITLEDLSANIKPLLRLFFVCAIVPYLFVWLLGLEDWFINTVGGAVLYLGNRRSAWRYLEITARKPGPESDGKFGEKVNGGSCHGVRDERGDREGVS